MLAKTACPTCLTETIDVAADGAPARSLRHKSVTVMWREASFHDREDFSVCADSKPFAIMVEAPFSERISMIVKDLVPQGVLNPSRS
jgi:hypothetical protein